MDDSIVIGIDLGTTNTCVGYFWKRRIEIMENKEGDRTTPSIISFIDTNKTVVGKYAKKLSDTKCEHSVFGVKRLIGRQYNDSRIQSNLGKFHFELERCNGDLFKIVIDTKEGVLKKTPEEVCMLILNKIKSDVDRKFGTNITKAVITVPAYFNVNQRQSTLEAAKSAGFDVLKLLNEPTAAALSYFYRNNRNQTGYALVYDLGGGTFDVAILKRSKNQIDIICVDGDSYLGGHDIDALLVEYVCKILKNQHKYNPYVKSEDMRRIMNECEEAKKALSDLEETNITFTGFLNVPITITLTRSNFEKEAEELFQRTINIVDRCLKNSKLEKHEIKEIILVGGSTRIPKVQQLISEYFNRNDLNQFVHPDECVAEGAALQAAMLSLNPRQKIGKFTLHDVTGLSIGISDIVDVMEVIIPKNSNLPIGHSTSRVNVFDKQISMTINIYEGERINAKKNYLLAQLTIEDLTPAPPRQCKVTITLSIDRNGILTATATEELSGKTKDLKITYTRGNRSDFEIKSMIIDAEINKKEDEIFKKMASMKRYLVNYCTAIKYNLEEKKLKRKYQEMYDDCDQNICKALRLNVGDDQEIKHMVQETESKGNVLIRKYNFTGLPTATLKSV